jgi:sortase (surface protein transpeptidase)
MLKIPAITLSAPVVKTGLEKDGSLHVPGAPELAGWYSLGPRPGEVGPSVITGHFDSAKGPGVFYDLRKAGPGNEINVVRNDGSVAVFVIDKLEIYPQENFNTQAVYGSISTSGLRLITCAGAYDKTTKHYSDDLVVYATLKEIRQAAQYNPL